MMQETEVRKLVERIETLMKNLQNVMETLPDDPFVGVFGTVCLTQFETMVETLKEVLGESAMQIGTKLTTVEENFERIRPHVDARLAERRAAHN